MQAEHFFFIQSTFILIIITIGLFFRKNRKVHPRIMGFAIAWDIILVLQIELSQGAIKQTIEYTKNTALLNFHIAIATLTVIGYFAIIYTGRKILKGTNSLKKQHKALGISIYLLRWTTYLTSFFVMGP